MRVLQISFPENAVEELQKFLKSVKSVRVFRRAQAVLEVVKGKPMRAVSREYNFSYHALWTWVHRFKENGIEGLQDRPRTGRPKKVTAEVERVVVELIENDPLEYNSIYSQWTCSELLRVVEEKTGVRISRETLRTILKKTDIASIVQQRS